MIDQACLSCSSRLKCSNPDINPVNPRYAWNITATGEVWVDGTVRNISEYCIESRGHENNLLFCPVEVDNQPLINRICQCLSMISILVTIILHLIIKDLRCLNFTKLKIPFLVCLFFVNVGFNATKSSVILGLAYQYIFLGFFFWLTSMSVDIWLTFRRISNPLQNRNNEDAVHRMRRYYIFSLGSPAIISLVTRALQFAYTPEEAPYIHQR